MQKSNKDNSGQNADLDGVHNQEQELKILETKESTNEILPPVSKFPMIDENKIGSSDRDYNGKLEKT